MPLMSAAGGAGGISGGPSETSSGVESSQDLMNSSGINFGNYYGGQTIASGAATATGSIPMANLLIIGGGLLLAAVVFRGRK